jgi:hypothetical protein
MATSFNIGGGAGRARRAVPGLLFAPLALLAAVTAAQTDPTAPNSKPVFEGPRLAIAEKEQDFGLVMRGEVLEATFELQNVGTEPLKILHVKPG